MVGTLRVSGAALVAVLAGACGGDREFEAPQFVAAPPVEAVEARFGGLPLVERLSGTVRAENQVELYPEISGRIAAVFVENGDAVEAGQALVELDDDQASEQVRQAEAGLRIAEARLRQAQAQRNELEAEARRTRSLAEQALVSELELETILAQIESAAADIDLAQAQVEQAAANLAQQRDLLAKTVIRAPIEGIVGQRNAEVGMQATPSTQLFTIGNLDKVEVRVQLADSMLRYIAAGQTVQIPLEGGDELTATLTRISPFLDEITRSAQAEIEIDNASHRLRPGMFVPVDILHGQSSQATLVPSSALFTHPDTGREGVYVLTQPPPPNGGTPSPDDPGSSLSPPIPVEFRPTRVLARGAMEIAVEAVDPGEWVVTLGQDLLSAGRDQARVRTVDWEHVMALQGMRREDLLDAVLRPEDPTATPNT